MMGESFGTLFGLMEHPYAFHDKYNSAEIIISCSNQLSHCNDKLTQLN